MALSEALHHEKPEWKPLRAEWSLQGAVVDGMIRALEKSTPNDYFEAVAAVLAHAIGRPGIIGANAILRNYFTVYYKGVEEKEVPARLLADLKKQRAFLVQAETLPTPARVHKETLSDIVEAHDIWRAAQNH